MADGELRTYLNAHLAGSTTALELLGHMTGEHEGTELGDFLACLRSEIAEDQDALREIMSSLELAEDRSKLALAWVAEKAARVTTRGDLGTLLELEQLELGITGKLLLWRALTQVQGATPQLEALIARAERQREGVERHRLEAARAVLAPGAA